MAARLNPRHQEMVRQKIRASQLINRLQNYALAKAGNKNFVDMAMSDGQIRAAVSLLAKCVPDVQRTELTGQGGGPLEITVKQYVVAAK